jgi:Nucleolar pre-ribosomal-associated protein 1
MAYALLEICQCALTAAHAVEADAGATHSTAVQRRAGDSRPHPRHGGRGSSSSNELSVLLRSSKRSHQLMAVLQWTRAGVAALDSSGGEDDGEHPQLPSAAAVLSAEAALLLAAPAALMHDTVRKLLLRQPALDTAGLPLLRRILAGAGGSGGARGAAVAVSERHWLLRLLWMGLRVRRVMDRRTDGGQIFLSSPPCMPCVCVYRCLLVQCAACACKRVLTLR